MNEVFEALKRIETTFSLNKEGKESVYREYTNSIYPYYEDFDLVLNALNELKQIKESNPSEVLEETLRDIIMDLEYDDNPFLRDRYYGLLDVKQALIKAKEQEEENARAFGKDIISLNKTLKQTIDEPILYFSRYGNKYVVPQELFEKQCNVLSIINNKEVNMIRFKAVVMINGNADDYNKDEEYKERHLTDKEFELIKEWLDV